MADPQNIRILNSPCIEHEVREAARIIKKKIIMGETNPDRVAIYIKNPVMYMDTIRDVFDEMGIPVRMNEGEMMFSVPIVKDILSLLSFIIKGGDIENFKNIISSKYLFSQSEESKLEKQLSEDKRFDSIIENMLSYINLIPGSTSLNSENSQECIKTLLGS